MNSTLEGSQISHIFIFLVVNVLYITNGIDDVNKFDSKSKKALFISYSSSNKGFMCLEKGLWRLKNSYIYFFDEFSSSNNKLRNKEDQENWMLSHTY